MQKHEHLELPPVEIVSAYEKNESIGTENDPQWTAKIGRYLAYCVDGGFLQSHFTIRTLIRILPQVTDALDESMLRDEILYLLHVRKKGEKYVRGQDPITAVANNLVNNPQAYDYNLKVLRELIETGYIQSNFA